MIKINDNGFYWTIAKIRGCTFCDHRDWGVKGIKERLGLVSVEVFEINDEMYSLDELTGVCQECITKRATGLREDLCIKVRSVLKAILEKDPISLLEYEE